MHTTYPVHTQKKCAISLHIVRKSRCAHCAVSLHLVCILRVFTKCLHSLHKVCICFHKLVTKCALSVPDADFAESMQTWCNETPVQPVLARRLYKHHRPDCTQTLQTSRPCPKSPDFIRTLSQPPVSSRHGAAKMKVANNTAESSALARLPNQDQASKCA